FFLYFKKLINFLQVVFFLYFFKHFQSKESKPYYRGSNWDAMIILHVYVYLNIKLFAKIYKSTPAKI
ncbi:hypothetical protein, partial [Escherichia coli]|uniref:hypothetical protein n=1 Tax=Escherichia coli TaxID=562 RepID=UPI0032DAB1AB